MERSRDTGDVVDLMLQMSEWIANNREVFLVTYTQIGSSHQQALDLQSEHNQFAMSAMVCFVNSYLALTLIIFLFFGTRFFSMG